MLGSRALRAAAKLYYVKTLADQSAVPVPRDAQVVRSGAEDPDRVLLVGNGPTHGWGTVTHELALTGQLGRALTRRTGRATDVEYIGSETMNLASVLPWIGSRALDGFDLVVVVLSMNDAVRLTPVDPYRADMERLLEKLTAETKPSARVVVAGIHPVASLPHYRGVAARLGQRQADRLNASTREIVGRFDGTAYMDLEAPEPEAGRPYGSPGMYAEWSEAFVDVCAPALEEARALDSERRPVAAGDHDWQWAPARHIVDDLPEEGWQGLDRVVEHAKEDFGVDVAYVTLIDGDQQYYVASTGPGMRSIPLELSHCKVTVEGEDVVMTDNSLKDERFKDSPLHDVTQLRFYAGVPLKNEQGDNVGTFCVAAVRPGAERVSETQMRLFAARAQEELQRLAADRSGTVATTDEDASSRS